jgi:MFS family permease
MVIVDPPRRPQASDATAVGDAAGHKSWVLLLSLLVLLQAVTNMIFFVMPTQMSFFLEAQGYDAAMMTGAILGTVMLSGGGFALIYPRLQRATGYAGIFLMGYASMALGFLLLLLAGTTPTLFAAAASIGAGYALVSPSFVALTLSLAPLRRRGVSGGVLTASIFIGQFVSPLLVTPLITRHGYGTLFGGMTLLLAAMAVAAGVAGALARTARR